MRILSVLLALCVAVLVPVLSHGQAHDLAPSQKIDNDFVHRAFGDEFTIVPEIGGMVGDLDGDGVEDVVIAARSKNPMLDQGEHNYVVMDPFYDFFGYGDPKVTSSFVAETPERHGLVVLIIHGAGPEAWRSETPKAKFVLINIAYRSLSVRKMRLGKKTIQAIYAEEADEAHDTSAMFFDGKKYKYVPMGSSME